MSAKSYYESSPVYSLDQTDTIKALGAIQNFIDLYPNSNFFTNSNELVEKLQYKLEKKDFEIAKGYYKTGEFDLRNYKAAMVAFDNLILEHLGTSFKEDAIYYKFLSAYELAVNSFDNVKGERLENAKTILTKFKKNYPDSEHLDDLSKYERKLDKAMNILTTENN
jgi:outer membrane protein assembly factor BamD